MPRDKTKNHVKIMAAARDEFREYGFERASMRRIGERCGMTAAGIYRHCRDKSDLFDQLVTPAAESIRAWMKSNMLRVSDASSRDAAALWPDFFADMMRELIYPDMDEYFLLFCRAHGTKYENFLREFVDEQQSSLISYISEQNGRQYAASDIEPERLRIVLTAYMTALFEPVVLDYSLDKALQCLDTARAFFKPGWREIMT